MHFYLQRNCNFTKNCTSKYQLLCNTVQLRRWKLLGMYDEDHLKIIMPLQKIISQLYLLTSLIRANHVRQFQLQRRQLVKNYVCHRVALLSCEKKDDIYLFLQSCTNPHPSIYLSTTLYVESAKYLFFTVSLQFKKKCVLFKEPQHTTFTSRAYAQLYKLWRLQFSSNTNSDIRVSPLGWNRIYQSLGCRSITLKFLTTYTKLKIVFAFQSVMI